MLMIPVAEDCYIVTVYYNKKRRDSDDDPYDIIVAVRGRDADGHHYRLKLEASCSETDALIARGIKTLITASDLMQEEFTAEVSVTSNDSDTAANSLMQALEMRIRNLLHELNNPASV